MSKIYHLSDLHLGQVNVLHYRPYFKSMEHHDETIVDNIVKTLNKRDTLYLHGDCFIYAEATEKYLEAIYGSCAHVHLIQGNHDFERMRADERLHWQREIVNHPHSKGLSGLIKHKRCWLSHAPIHVDELRGKFNIHGHTHSYNLFDIRYVNVSCENVNFTPVCRDEIESQIADGRLFKLECDYVS